MRFFRWVKRKIREKADQPFIPGPERAWMSCWRSRD